MKLIATYLAVTLAGLLLTNYCAIAQTGNYFAGFQSGLGNTGSYNTFVGFQSAITGNSGVSNTFLGYSAGLKHK